MTSHPAVVGSAVGLGGQRCQVTSLAVAVAVQPLWWAIV